jgi:alanyl-tRNA synthetase
VIAVWNVHPETFLILAIWCLGFFPFLLYSSCMPPQSTSDIRAAYLTFFEGHDHAIIKGASLIPENDPTVLFTTAGMHPLVPYLLGEPHPSGKRLVDVQRCIRTQDIDEVGDASHLTCFEMLGNWSLGDYCKKEAIAMSYEFLTVTLGLNPKYLSVSCFGGDDRFPAMARDDEAAEYWKSVGISEDRIGFIKGGMLESENNWWGPAGKTGPCGPDTEMFYWIGDGEPHGNPAVNPDDWMEIWNDVFMQYNKKEDATFEPLAQQNVDTGMGLERTAAVMQGVESVYEIDSVLPIFSQVLQVAGCRSQGGKPSHLNLQPSVLRHARIITDHLKAAVFIIMDGITPSNVDQGYVLRKLIRRAIRSGKQLKIDSAFTVQIADEVIRQYGDFYTQLFKKKDAIHDALKNEEEQFGKTLKEGLKHFEKTIASLRGKQIDGVSAFHLYDTYGFPLELTVEMAKEKGFFVDEKGFRKAFEEHQNLSRAGAEHRFAGGLADHSSETTKLHTATHLLNAALRKVLGDHIQQKGSNITQERLRFDFNHDEKLTKEQLAEVEKHVNEQIKADLPVSYHVTTVDGAKGEGAIGVFDERYASMALSTGGDEVKVYQVGDGSFSKEICGGPHVAQTGMIGEFKITKEESSSAGVRRIKAVVSGGPKAIEVAPESTKPQVGA